MVFFRQLFVSQEIMLQPIDQPRRRVGDVLDVPVAHVGLEHGNDFIVGFVAVDHAEAADRHRPDNEVAVRGGPLREHADIERIAIAVDRAASGAFLAEPRHLESAEGLRDETVRRRAHAGESLRAIDAQMTGRFIELVLHRVRRDDFDVGVDDSGCLRTGRHAMPRMRFEELREQVA